MSDRIEDSYRRVLAVCTLAAFVLLLVVYVLYVLGCVPVHTPHAQVALHWGKNTEEFLQATGRQAGWSWLRQLGYGDMLCLLGVACLGIVVPICYLRILPALAGRRDRIHVVLVILQLIVRALAATGVL